MDIEMEQQNPDMTAADVARALIEDARNMLEQLPEHEAADLLAALRDSSSVIAEHMRNDALLSLPGQAGPYSSSPAHIAVSNIENASIGIFASEHSQKQAALGSEFVNSRKRLSITEHDHKAWKAMTPGRRAANKVLNITRCIKKKLQQLPWNPIENPSDEEVEHFVLNTQGGSGNVTSDESFLQTKQALAGSWCGSFHWHKVEKGARQQEPARYLIANIEGGDVKPVNVHLLKYYVRYVWNLRKPDFILSVTGGAQPFELNSDEKDKIFKGMMEATRGFSTWFTTGGTDAGVMKYLGEARAKFNPDAPLIGIVALGVIKGGSAFQARTKKNTEADDGTIGNYWDMSKDCDDTEYKGGMPPGLDCNHSHFIFAHDGGPPASQNPDFRRNFGGEIALRANFESATSSRFPPFRFHNLNIRPYESGWPTRKMEENILNSMLEKEIGWRNISMKKPSNKKDFKSTPIVSICVQGGIGSLDTVTSATRNGTPVLLVKGSGRAANFMADMVILRYGPEHELHLKPAQFDPNQRKMFDFFLHQCGFNPDVRADGTCDIIHDPEGEDNGYYDFKGIISILAKVIRCIRDVEDIEVLETAINHAVDSDKKKALVDIQEWVKDYAGRAASMPRNLYGHTFKEIKEFMPMLQPSEHKMIEALCDREGLFCNIRQGEHGKTVILLRSRSEYTGFEKGDALAARSLPRRDWHTQDQEILAKSKAIEKAAQEVLHSYEMPTFGASRIMHDTLVAILTNKCWVYDAHSTDRNAPDFKSCLLHCLINGLGHPSLDDSNTLLTKLNYTILWERVDVMKTVLERSGLRAPHERFPVLDAALIQAISRNHVSAVEVLHEMGASFDQFGVIVRNPSAEVESLLHLVKTAALEMNFQGTNAKLPGQRVRVSWDMLIRTSLQDFNSEHVKMLMAEEKDILEDTSMAVKTTGSNSIFQVQQKNVQRHTDDVLEPMSRYERRSTFQIITAQTMLLKQLLKDPASREARATRIDSQFKCLKLLKVSRHVIVLESLYCHLLGDSFRYKFGIQKPIFDLFLWSVLMNRLEMAVLFWKFCDFPVRCAITAACLLRKMATNDAVNPIVSEAMKDHANYFENLAIAVQTQARKDDRNLATQALNVPLIIWRGMSLLDVTMEARCYRFLEVCCKQTLDDLETGDISPYGDEWINLKLFFCIITGGLPLFLFPDMFVFKPPPRSEFVRSATQRRACATGFPFNPKGNPTLKKLFESFLEAKGKSSDKENFKSLKHTNDPQFAQSHLNILSKRHKSVQSFANMVLHQTDDRDHLQSTLAQLLDAANEVRVHLRSKMDAKSKKAMRQMQKLEADPNFKLLISDEQLNQLWEPTFGAYDRWLLFWRVPKVLYFANAVVQMVVTVLFLYMHIFLNTPDVREKERTQTGRNIENIVLTYCFSSAVREVVELAISEKNIMAEIFSQFWTVIDFLQIITFMYGIVLRGGEAGFPNYEAGLQYTDHLSGITWWKFYYGLSLFFLCIRFLRILTIVNQQLCLLVIIFTHMLPEVLNWSFVYATFTVAFSVLLFGCGDNRGAQDNCFIEGVNSTVHRKPATDKLPSGSTGSYVYSECLPQWWIVRTIWQGFGQLFLEDMTNALAVVIVLLAFITLNVILLNLLIAMMSGTFETIKQQAKGQGMIEQCGRIKEFSRTSLGTPPFFNVFVISWDIYYFFKNLSSMQKKYVGCSFFKLLDIYISRNHHDIHYEWEETANDRRNLDSLASFMEGARAKFLEEECQEDQLLQLHSKLDLTEGHISSQMQHLQDTIERKSDYVVRSIQRSNAESLDKLGSPAKRGLPCCVYSQNATCEQPGMAIFSMCHSSRCQ